MIMKWLRRVLAIVLVVVGLYLAIFGNAWAPFVLGLLGDSTLGEWIELVVPLLPMIVIGAGGVVFAWKRQ